MPLSKHYIDTLPRSTRFDIGSLGIALRDACPESDMAFLLGSAVDGTVPAHSDLDIAVWIKGKSSLELYDNVFRICDEIVPDVRCDLGILNNADPIYRFEALKGRLLFARDQEQYLRFYSLTCREYESQLADYERQRHYRLTA